MSSILNVVLGFITGLLLVALRYEYTKRTKLEERLFKDKASLYSTFLEKISELILKKPDPNKVPKDLIRYMSKFKFMLMLFASDEVYRTFLELQEAPKQKNITPNLMGRLFMVLRKDIVKETQLTSKELLSGVISDIDKHFKDLSNKEPDKA